MVIPFFLLHLGSDVIRPHHKAGHRPVLGRLDLDRLGDGEERQLADSLAAHHVPALRRLRRLVLAPPVAD